MDILWFEDICLITRLVRLGPKCKDDLDQRDSKKVTRNACVSFGGFSRYSHKDAKGYHKEF